MDTSRRNNPEEARCILGLQDLKIGSKSEDATEQAHNTSHKPSPSSKTRPVGAIESFVLDCAQPRPDYSFYERSNVIAASKFATPKRVETIASSVKRENGPSRSSLSASPACSVDGLSQRSFGYQTEDLYEIPADPTVPFVPPVYENVDYYGDRPSPQPPYYHPMYQHPPPPPPTDGYYDTRYSKAQPQVPVHSKLAHPAVYENMMCSDKDKMNDFKLNSEQCFIQQGSMPGPQVPNMNILNRVPLDSTSLNKMKIDKLPPPPPYSVVQDTPGSDYTVMKSAPPKYTDTSSLTSRDSSASVSRDIKSVVIPSVPTTAIYASIAPSAQRPKANIATEVQTAISSPKFYHPKPALAHSIGKDRPSTLNGAYSPKPITVNRMQIVDDVNGSDYVCMMGGNSTATTNAAICNKDNISVTSESLGSRNMVSGLTSLCSPAPSPAPSPTPSSISQLSGGSRGSGGRGKSLLPYSITPPRPPGPSEAQRKIEELTRQLEEEMEKQDEEGEYFGDYIFYLLLIFALKYFLCVTTLTTEANLLCTMSAKDSYLLDLVCR